MLNIKLICKIMGSLLVLEAFFMLICLGVSIIYNENDIFSFGISIAITLVTAIALHYAGAKADNNMSRRDAFLVVTLSWSIFSLFGALPFMIGGYITSFTNAYFETISGFTTTGATILDDVECLPHGILFWRSFTQWIGGLGIVFFTIAVFRKNVSAPRCSNCFFAYTILRFLYNRPPFPAREPPRARKCAAAFLSLYSINSAF